MSEVIINPVSPVGKYRRAWYGYSLNKAIAQNAASGGIVTSTLNYIIKSGVVDAALVCRSQFLDGKMKHEIYLAKSLDELLLSQTSKYFDIPMQNGIELIKNFQGKVAFVGLPSQVTSIAKRCERNADLASKVVFKIAIFCGHNSQDVLLYRVLEKKGISRNSIKRFYYRKGWWRGNMVVEIKDGRVLEFPFQEFSDYQNLHILSLDRCLNCCDHMGYNADLSTGDVWRQEMKSHAQKHSVFIARSQVAENVILRMIQEKELAANEVSRKEVYLSQKRSINYHYNLSARSKIGKILGFKIRDRTNTRVKWRDFLAALIVLFNHRISKNEAALKMVFRMPRFLIRAYLYLFKGLTHYERDDY